MRDVQSAASRAMNTASLRLLRRWSLLLLRLLVLLLLLVHDGQRRTQHKGVARRVRAVDKGGMCRGQGYETIE